MTGVGLLAGLVGPIIFVGGFFILGVYLTPDYRPRYTFASQLALGRLGRVWQVANCTAGVLIAAFGFTLQADFGPDTASSSGGWALVVAGVGFVVFGISKDDPWLLYPPASAPPWVDRPVTKHGWGHQVGAIIAGAGLLAAHFAFAWHFASTGHPWWYAYCVLTGVAFPVVYVLADASALVSGRSTGPLGGNAGLLQKVSMSTSLLWVAMLALRLAL